MVPPSIQPIACREGACGSGSWPARHPEGAGAFKGYRGATPETFYYSGRTRCSSGGSCIREKAL
jgi:hypothetical protein